ncbi:hypothetical protein DPEC_G00196720 [Dallia pectoralis]|uniref:Uncharacterized protein n=1 Tax=Dallia pectoralis TaxID=75939 RepID=A0ACC2G803_DALPE|nr:hypothetical protein DPEC_G00196720 [Dallia pectoralis]
MIQRSVYLYWAHNVSPHERPCESAIPVGSNNILRCDPPLRWGTPQENQYVNDQPRRHPMPIQPDAGVRSTQPIVQMNGQTGTCGSLAFCPEPGPLRSGASAAGPWAQPFYASVSHLVNMVNQGTRRKRSSLTRYITGHARPQFERAAQPADFRLRFEKCAQMGAGTGFPHLTFVLLIHNLAPAGGTNLSQLAIRDSVSGIAPIQSGDVAVEKGFQTFTIDSLPAGASYTVTYTALIKGHASVVLDLPAFLTFSNASMNDVSMFGPVLANMTLRVNSTDKIYPNHGVHFAGFVGGFVLSFLLLTLGFLAMNLICARARMNSLQQRKKRGDSDPDYEVCNMSETVKEEAAFEDKLVDIMVLEEPQNMYQALENLEMSSLLQATSSLETSRVQMYKDVIAALLASLRSQNRMSRHASLRPQNHMSQHAEQRLLSVLHGQLMGMEGKLKEEHVARMAALAAQCNLETREQMEAEHRREAQEKAQLEGLFRHANQQELFLQVSVLLEKLHKLNHSQLQHTLLVKHEEASARVQRQIVEWRREELHKIFSEEMEEATRMGELEKTMARSLMKDYYSYQNQLEEVLDVVLANKRCMLGERHAQRKFLVHSLYSLKGLISETFSKTSSQMENCYKEHLMGSNVFEEQMEQRLDKVQMELVLVKQRLEEALSRERRAMHCGLVKKRRELISDMLQCHKQRQWELSARSRGGLKDEEVLEVDPAQHLLSWQSMLTSQCQELGELINNLDEEAAADIRKVTMRVIHSSMAEVKAIQAAATQALLDLGPPRGPNQQPGAKAPTGAGTSALSQAQERLHLEGKGAVRILQASRDSLRQGMMRELQGQLELRARGWAFFRSLCSSQLTLSDEELLRLMLEFQKCLSRMGHCLVLPHALTRSKLQAAVTSWRKEMQEKQTETSLYCENKTRPTGKSAKDRQRASPTELLLFQRTIEDRIQLFEKEKEMENIFMEKVLEEMLGEREAELQSQMDGLAVQMATLHYQKAETRTSVLETSRALLTVQSLITEELRAGRSLASVPLAQSIQNHCLGLEEAEHKLQREHDELESLETGPRRPPEHKPPKDLEAAAYEDESEEEDGRLFQIERGSRMAAVLREALYKCDQVNSLQMERQQEANARSQAMEDLKEQLELKRLYTNCDQDLEFAAKLVRQSQMSTEVLLEALRLLLPTLPESELLSLMDALCPKQTTPPGSTEQPSPGGPEGAGKSLLFRLRVEMVGRYLSAQSTDLDPNQFQGRRPSLLEKLFVNTRPEAPRENTQVLVQEKEGNTILTAQPHTPKPVATGTIQTEASEQPRDSVVNLAGGASNVHSDTVLDSTSARPCGSADDSAVTDVSCAGERVFVFRAPPDPESTAGATDRKRRKRNFLNLKKGSVAPLDQP